MRKQTKLVAVASAAALLAIGASMTSFAATGWVEESGEWYFYDNDGTRVEDEWKKSGDKWFWLDSENEGAMAIDKLVDDGDNIYYVDSTGAMVSNTWVKVVNEDQDDDDDPAEYNYYYMQANGKAYKGNGNSTKFRTIDGKRYAFDEDGKMLYGWVDKEGNRKNGDDEWADESTSYYLGSWDTGWLRTGWQKIYVHDSVEDDDMDHWFYFKSNGEKEYAKDADKTTVKEKTVNGRKYGFDERGVMVYQWTIASDSSTYPDGSASASDWKYFNSPEDGARVTKGWFKVIAPGEDNSFRSVANGFAKTDADEENERWYYADGSGNLAVGEIKKIKGKYYGFRPEGDKGAAMLSGLCLLEVDSNNGAIKTVIEADMDSDTLDNIIDETGDYNPVDGKKSDWLDNTEVTLYYFGNDADSDGVMKTGSTTVNLDGSSYNFLFSKSGGAEGKGRGLTGIDDEKYIYKYGLKIKAGTDDKYRVVRVLAPEGAIGKDTGTTGVQVAKISSSRLRAGDYIGVLDSKKNDDNETVKAIGVDGQTWGENYYLVNTSGAISKKKSAAKDGDDWYFYVNSDKQIVLYTNNKNLKKTPFDAWEDWALPKPEDEEA